MELMRLVRAGRVAQSVNVVARLGVADHLAGGPRGVAEIAAAVGAQPGALRRVLHLLADYGVVTRVGDDRFGLTPMGELLRSDTAGSLRAMAMLLESPFLLAAVANLTGAVRTGVPAFDHTHERSLFEYLAEHPDDSGVFDLAMAGYVQRFVAGILDVYDFGPFRTFVDVGGGNGAFLTAALARHRDARAILFELPAVAGRARATLAAGDVGARCDVVEGDFFRSVPSGGDVYVLSRIIHDWYDTAAVRILTNCRAAMTGDARLVIAEAVLPEAHPSPQEPSLARLVDIEMLVIGGRERTRQEYYDLLAAAGLRLARTVPVDGVHSLIEATAA
jgi:O-methyltransferase domain